MMTRIMLALVFSFGTSMAAAKEVPALPVPDGPYHVGFTRFELTDASRKGVLTGDTSEPRAIPVVAWYPAAGTQGEGRTYFDAQEALDEGRSLERNLEYAPGELAMLARLHVSSTLDAPAAEGRFPIVIFSHGFFLYPAQNSMLAEELASHGYVVLSIGHLHDGVDFRLANGWLMPTLLPPGDSPVLTKILSRIAGNVTNEERVDALSAYPKALMDDRLGTSLAAWINDTLFVADSIEHGAFPPAAAGLLKVGDRSRLILAGMSFGGTTSAATCRLIAACVAAVNLDGENFDPALFDRPVGRPLLMLHSDWTKYELWPGQSHDPAFNPNDLAYEPWAKVGTSPDVIRLRLVGARHMAFTDLLWILRGPKAIRRFGTIAPEQAVSAIDAMVLAFVDVYAKGAPRDRLAEALRDHPQLVPHDPALVRSWAAHSGRNISLSCIVPCAERVAPSNPK